MSLLPKVWFALILACFSLASPVFADDPPATISWIGTTDSSWDVPANWNPARIPDASDHVEIAAGSNVFLNVNASIASLRIGTDAGTVTQALVLNAGTTLTLATNSVVRSRGLIEFSPAEPSMDLACWRLEAR